MLWCSHCGVLVPPMRDDNQFVRARSVKSVSSDASHSFEGTLNEGFWSKRDVGTNPAMLLKKHSPRSKKKSKAIIIHDGDANGQNPLTIEHESDITENDFKLRQDHEIVKGGGDGGPANYKWHVPNQENVHASSYDADYD